MIYKKNANFPYPILSETTEYYIDNGFNLDVEVNEDTDNFYFNIQYDITSKFMNETINEGKAQLILIIKTQDSKFYPLQKDNRVIIPKNRISLSNRTEIQLYIQALDRINFEHNNDLNPFYDQYKKEIVVDKYNLLGYSDVITFNGNIRKPFDLFDKSYDSDLSSDIKFELGAESIIIHYRDQNYLFQGAHKANYLNNAYIYMGLSRALQELIYKYGEDGEVDILDTDTDDLLDLKLLNLMRSKQVGTLNTENLDEVIYAISDKVIERFVRAVRRLESNGN